MKSLVIHHNIFLTRDERYQLHERKPLECVGVSTPVWIFDEKTSEPGREVFCRYYINNNDKKIPICLAKDGYEICLPDRPALGLPQTIDNDQWRALTVQEKEELYSFQQPGVSSADLLDVCDGGTCAMMYREHTRIVHDNNQKIHIVHLVQIRDVDYLNGSTIFKPRWLAGNHAELAKVST